VANKDNKTMAHLVIERSVQTPTPINTGVIIIYIHRDFSSFREIQKPVIE